MRDDINTSGDWWLEPDGPNRVRYTICGGDRDFPREVATVEADDPGFDAPTGPPSRTARARAFADAKLLCSAKRMRAALVELFDAVDGSLFWDEYERIESAMRAAQSVIDAVELRAPAEERTSP